MSGARCALLGLLLACAPGGEAGPPRVDPRGAAAWVERGDAALERYRDTRSPEAVSAAELAYELARELDPASADALAGLGHVRGIGHEFEESLAFAERALWRDPEHRGAHGVLADAAFELGRIELAAKHVEAMLALRPDLASYARGARVLERQGEPARAAELMRHAIAAGAPRAESTSWCRAELARMLGRQGRVLEAERVIAEALALAPEHPDVLAAAAALRAPLPARSASAPASASIGGAGSGTTP
jgi:tetratricopeptide (TPR) repeat protein